MKVNITNLTDAPVTWREVRLDLPDSILDMGWSGAGQDNSRCKVTNW
jgi:hypothetical protein